MPKLVGTRKVFNASCDVDILAAATARLKLLGLDRSGFIEQQFVALLTWSDPLVFLLEAAKSGEELDLQAVKLQLRRRLPEVQALMSHAHGDLADMMQWSVEDPTHNNE